MTTPDRAAATPGRIAFGALDDVMIKTVPNWGPRMSHDEAWASFTDAEREAYEASAQAVLNQAFPGLEREREDLRRELGEARAALRWWICDGPLPAGGKKILGPFSSQELAIEVRSYVEQVTGPGKLWVDDEDPQAAASPDAAATPDGAV